MFRIKPTRNQTTAKHVNLSPYPNFKHPQLNNERDKRIENTNVNKNLGTTYLNQKNLFENKIKNVVQVNKNIKNPQATNNIKVSNQVNIQTNKNNNIVLNQNKITKNARFTPIKKSRPQNELIKKQIINPQKPQQLKNLSQISSKSNNARILLKRPENANHQPKEHKLKMKDQKKVEKESKQITQNRQSKVLNHNQQFEQKNNKGIQLHKQKQEDFPHKVVQKCKKQQFNEKSENIIKKDANMKIQQNSICKDKIQEKSVFISQKNYQNQPRKNKQNQQIISQQDDKNLQEKRLIKEQKKQIKDKDQQTILKQKQMQQLMLKIQKRRQTRQKQKKRIKQLQQKQRENQQRALQFMAQKQKRSSNNQNLQQNSGVSGMLKLNDQLMHFSLAQSIMDLQIKKLLKTKFDQFPNASQIKYQIQELQRINLSYEMIKFDENNPLKNGLKNYRIQIFNRIGDLILKAQQEGYSNPNFNIIQSDGRAFNRENRFMPQATKGLPKQNHKDFIKYQKPSKNQSQQECAICIIKISSQQIAAHLQCGHIFHEHCIKDWILSSANCPTCRFNIKFGKRG